LSLFFALHPNLLLRIKITDVAQLIDVTEAYNMRPTVEGNHLYLLKISDNVAVDEDEPNVLVISNHHAREMITPEIAVTLAQRLVEGFLEGDEYLSNMVKNNQIYVAYTWNPDGLDHIWNADNNWRKNRSYNTGGSRGVDLNRNYPFGWDFTCAGSTVQTSQTYKGLSAGSEIETQTAMAFIKDKNVDKYLDFHSSGRDVRYLYAACATMPEPLFSYYQDIAGEISREMDYVVRDSCCTGGAIANAYFDTGAMSYLSETGTSFQPPAEAMRAEVERVLPGAYKFIDFAMPISGRVVDAETGAPIFAGQPMNFCCVSESTEQHAH
jgi:predicted deacylase